MKSTLLRRTAVAVLPFALSMSAWADFSSTATLTAGQGLSFDSGVTGATGDIIFTGTSITFQGGAKGFNLGSVGAAEYGAINASEAGALSQIAATTPIPITQLVVGDVFALVTKGANVAKAMVTASSSSSLAVQFTTYGNTTGTGTGSGGPTITNITNNYSYTPNGFVNSGISPSTIFTIFGSNLAAPSTGAAAGLQDSTKGIPTTWNQATVTVNAGGKNFTPGLYYALPTQIAAVLPAATPVGSATVTVNFNGASNAFAIQVVPNALGLDSYYGTGSGLITATNPTTGALYNYTNSAPLGQPVVFWGSGSGANSQDSDTVFTTTPHPVNQSNTQFYVGNVQATVLYAGSSGYPGLNQYNVVIPSNAPTGCFDSVAAVINGVPSNFGLLPVEPSGGVCIDSIFGITGNQLTSQATQINVSSGSVLLFQATTPGTTAGSTKVNAGASARFVQTTGSSYGSSSGLASLGSCTVAETGTASVTATVTGLDAGTITLTNPSGTQVTLTSEGALSALLAGTYGAQLPSTFIPSTGGTFTFNGSGGANVGPFTAALTFPNPPLVWTNQPTAATVTRSSGVTVTWTGGTAGTFVIISGSSSSTSGVSGMYTCLAPVGAQTFTVPPFVLASLPAGTGTTTVENFINYVTFAATGISSGFGFGGVSFQVNTTYQ